MRPVHGDSNGMTMVIEHWTDRVCGITYKQLIHYFDAIKNQLYRKVCFLSGVEKKQTWFNINSTLKLNVILIGNKMGTKTIFVKVYFTH